MKSSKEALSERRGFVRQFFRGNKITFAIAALATILVGCGNLAISWLLQQITDTISGSSDALPLSTLSVIFLAFILMMILLELVNYLTVPMFMKKAILQYKEYAFQKLTKKSIASFGAETTTTYLSALSNDVNSIEVNYLEQIFEFVSLIFLFTGSFIMMLFYSPLLTLIAALLSVLPVIASLITGNRLSEQEKNVSDRNESFIATLKDMLTGFTIVKSFKAEREIIRLLSESNRNAENAKFVRRRTSVIINLIGTVAGIVAQIGVFLSGAYLALSGEAITPGVIMAFVNLMNFVIQPISRIPSILSNRKAAFRLIDKLASALNANVRDEGEAVPKQLSDSISVEHLTYGYSPDTPVLHDITVTFQAGKSYAIVGGSGSGKSTLINLLMASSDCYEGKIRYDGHDIRNISSSSLFDLISIVQQNVFVFNASIRDNITMFRDFPEEDIHRAITLSGLSTLLQVRGKDELCGENGCTLSGGERQRISIARCLLRKTPVLLVDEATAALDKATAQHVTEAILDLKDLTRIVVTHALDASLLSRFDRILTLKSGVLIESGTFAELMEKKGYFYSLFTVSQ